MVYVILLIYCYFRHIMISQSFCKSIKSRKGNSIPKINVNPKEENSLPPLRWTVSHVNNLTSNWSSKRITSHLLFSAGL